MRMQWRTRRTGGRTAPALEPWLAARPVGPSYAGSTAAGQGQREWAQLAGEGRRRRGRRQSQRRRVSRASRWRWSARLGRPVANQRWQWLRRMWGGEVAGSAGSTDGRSGMISDRRLRDRCPFKAG